MIKEPTVKALAQAARADVGKQVFEGIEDKFTAYAEKQLLLIKLQKSINGLWKNLYAHEQLSRFWQGDQYGSDDTDLNPDTTAHDEAAVSETGKSSI